MKNPRTVKEACDTMLAAMFPDEQPGYDQRTQLEQSFYGGALVCINLVADGRASATYTELCEYRKVLDARANVHRTPGHG